MDETIEAFELLQQQGKIRYYGISSIRPNVIKEWVKRSRMVSVMMQYSLLDRRPEEECLQLLKKMDIGVLVRGGLAKGIIVDKPAVAYLDYSKEEVERMAGAVRSHSGKFRKSSQTALHFVLRNSAVSSIITGLRTEGQLDEIVGTMDVPRLTEGEEEQLRGVLPVNVYRDHR